MQKIIPFVSRGSRDEVVGWLEALRSAMPEFEVDELDALDQPALLEAEVAIVADPAPSDLQRLPKLRWVQSLWAGVERIVAELPDSEMKIVRLEDPQMARTMAEAVLAWTLYLHRDMPRYRRQQTQSKWQQHPVCLPSDRTIGFLGLGQLGREAARVLLEQDFSVCGWSRSRSDIEGITTFCGPSGLEAVLSKSDIVVILMPLTGQTRGIIDAKALSTMRKGAALINFARGALVDDRALLSALDSGHIDHAVLDVFDEEPLPPSSPYWSHPSVTVLPHISAPTTRSTASKIAASNIAQFFETGVIPQAIDRSRGY
ncbi:MAG: glyoxylate/hydroxypyruvate reductase A [Alphaproteobacteria bacterium]|nr:glyoxylate/hydroxypyruvate reductase A [Alphaproteobacteria bacterium]